MEELHDSECPGCGGELAETTNPANERQWEGVSTVCFRCGARDHARALAAEQDREFGAPTHGELWYVTDREEGDG